MTARIVHWHEGMFLKPQHFQAAQRHLFQLVHQNDRSTLHFGWGLRAIHIDQEALANYRFVVRSLQARLRDGTIVAIPEEGVLPAVELKAAFDENENVTIYLAVPLLNLGKANVSEDGKGENARFLTDTQELEDENTGVDPQPIQVRLLNLKLLLSTDNRSGYETLPIARVEKSHGAEANPQLDVTYIPPLLAGDAWPSFREGILQALYDRIGKKVELLAGQVLSRKISFGSQSQGDALIFAQLRELNEAQVLLGFLAFTAGIHPTQSFLELGRLVGRLAIFGETRRAPELPRYDHDDLGGCFFRLKQYLDALLEVVIEPAYKERPFVGAGLRMQVALEPTWLEPAWEMYVGVHSSLEPEECIRLLTAAGQMDMKVGSADRVDELFRLGHAGLRFEPCPSPPRILPSGPGLVFFQFKRDDTQTEWRHVQRSLTLAIRLNEKRIVGNIQGQRVLSIRNANQTTTLQFTLYLAPKD